jgi:hypothetical protein
LPGSDREEGKTGKGRKAARKAEKALKTGK